MKKKFEFLSVDFFKSAFERGPHIHMRPSVRVLYVILGFLALFYDIFEFFRSLFKRPAVA